MKAKLCTWIGCTMGSWKISIDCKGDYCSPSNQSLEDLQIILDSTWISLLHKSSHFPPQQEIFLEYGLTRYTLPYTHIDLHLLKWICMRVCVLMFVVMYVLMFVLMFVLNSYLSLYWCSYWYTECLFIIFIVDLSCVRYVSSLKYENACQRLLLKIPVLQNV